MSTGDYPYYVYSTSASAGSGNFYIGDAQPQRPQWNNIGSIPAVDELKEKLANLESLFFRKVVSKCPACGQWGAAMCECKYCGHPINLGEMP
jgi:hypothetical protein